MVQTKNHVFDTMTRQSEIGRFDQTIWIELLDRITTVFKIDKVRRNQLNSNPVFRLVAALPYLAGCDEPQRTSLSHMATFILAADDATRDVYAHNFQDSSDLRRRLEPISHFTNGHPRIIERGMQLLTLAMLSDHLHDAESDKALNKLNPIVAGHWDAVGMMSRIRRNLAMNPCPEMDEILNPDQAPSFWDH